MSVNNYLKKYKARSSYIEKIEPYIDKDLIKVIFGQRRVGKSFIFFQIIDYLREEKQVKDEQILYINKELYDFDAIRNYQDLLEYIKEYFANSKANLKSKRYIFIDEIQDIKEFEKALRSLNAESNYDIYCTGSNAYLLSSEIATFLRGRYISFEVFPLSYIEFLDFYSKEDSKEAFETYIKYGGMPYLIHLDSTNDVAYGYLCSVYNSVLLKDVVQRFEIRNSDFLNRLVLFIADNLGSLFSAKKISDYLKSQQVSLSSSVVMNYLDYLNSAYFVYQVKRADLQGKKIFQVNEKYYFNDLGIRHALIGYKQVDINKILENLVFMKLKQNAYEIYVGKIGDKEVDFIAQKQDEKVYIQVTYVMAEDSTRERELAPLQAIKDNHRKILVSMDELAGGNIDGIEHMHIRDFLLS